MKRIIVCTVMIIVLFAGLSFAVPYMPPLPDGMTGEAGGLHSSSKRVHNHTGISAQDAWEIRQGTEMQAVLRMVSSSVKGVRNQTMPSRGALFLLLAISAAITTGGRKSTLMSMMGIRLSFKDRTEQQIRLIYLGDGKKRPQLGNEVC